MTFRRLSLFILTAALGVSLVGCDLTGSEESLSPGDVTTGLYVTNGGAFGNSNSSYTVYNPISNNKVEIPTDRNGFASYIQSTTLHNDKNYLLFGETNTIGVFSQENKEIATVSGLENPRYMDVTGNTGYATGQDYTSSPAQLYEVNLSQNTLVDSVDVGGSPEGVLATPTTIFVALGGQDGSVAAVSASDLTLEKKIAVNCDAPRSLALDQNNELLVFCAGSTIRDSDFNVVERTDGAIRIVNPDTKSLKDGAGVSLDTMLTSATQGKRVSYSSERDEAFAVLAGQSVLRFDASTNTITGRINVPGAPIGTLLYADRRERLYIGRGDSDIFGAPGTVTVHRLDGEKVSMIDVGIAPIDLDIR